MGNWPQRRKFHFMCLSASIALELWWLLLIGWTKRVPRLLLYFCCYYHTSTARPRTYGQAIDSERDDGLAAQKRRRSKYQKPEKRRERKQCHRKMCHQLPRLISMAGHMVGRGVYHPKTAGLTFFGIQCSSLFLFLLLFCFFRYDGLEFNN